MCNDMQRHWWVVIWSSGFVKLKEFAEFCGLKQPSEASIFRNSIEMNIKRNLIMCLTLAAVMTCGAQVSTMDSPVPPRAKQRPSQEHAVAMPVPPRAKRGSVQERQAMSSGSKSKQQGRKHKNKYREVSYPTPNYDTVKVNEVKGVILHHTAEPTVERSLAVLTSKQKGVSTHVVIDTDGTRYVMLAPTVVAYHAGRSVLNGREGCNDFTIGIEFQGNTLENPLTDDQIASAIEYLLPIMSEYEIPVENVVTHEMVRQAYKARYPNRRCYNKVDITQVEYKRFMKAFKAKLGVD